MNAKPCSKCVNCVICMKSGNDKVFICSNYGKPFKTERSKTFYERLEEMFNVFILTF